MQLKMQVLLIVVSLDNYLLVIHYNNHKSTGLNSHRYLLQIIPLHEEDMVDTGGHLGCYLHVQLTCIAESMWKYIFFVCSDSIPVFV